jgi:hypothetical protein
MEPDGSSTRPARNVTIKNRNETAEEDVFLSLIEVPECDSWGPQENARKA